MVAFFTGEMIFSVGWAWSCSPRAFIMSTIFCGRGTTVRLCTPGGVTLVVAVAFEFSVDVWQPARIESRALHKTMAGAEYLERVIVGLHGKSIRMLFSPSRLSQKAGREQALPVKFLWSAHV